MDAFPYFVDYDVSPGGTYFYRVASVDAYGVVGEPYF
jgi:hypothetical protein